MTKLRILSAGVLLAVLGLTACDVDQTREARMPDVQVEGGQMPEYRVETPDVDVGTDRARMKVPDIDVKTSEREVTVPDIDVDIPEEADGPATK